MEHPITPPPELVGEWLCSEDYLLDASTFSYMTITSSRLQNIATQAARWGADQELEACCKVLHQHDRAYLLPSQLRAARRPKPPSLAEQALAALNKIEDKTLGPTIEEKLIRRAPEQLDE